MRSQRVGHDWATERQQWAYLLRSMWHLPRSGIEPVSPALAGRFFTTEPPGKPPLPSCSDFRTTLQGSLASRAPCGISGASGAIMLHAIQFLLCPSCRLYPLTDALLRAFLHQLCTCKSLSRAQFLGELHLDSTPEGIVTRFLQDQRVPLPTSETVEALRIVHHRSLVCVVWEDTVWHQVQTQSEKAEYSVERLQL